MSIDWIKQWELHAPHFKKGHAHLHPKGSEPFRLLPGPGFGDNSHPTTQLMLSLMPDLVKGRTVIDVGCGSGILSIAAAKMGAKAVHGIDIDPLALAHASRNAVLNNLNISFTNTYHTNEEAIYLMNMIPLEQKEAVTSLSPSPGSIWIVSGVLSDRPYKPGNIIKELHLDQWKGMVIINFNTNNLL